MVCYVNANGNGVSSTCVGGTVPTYIQTGTAGMIKVNAPVEFDGGEITVGNYAIIGNYPYLVPTQNSQVQAIANQINQEFATPFYSTPLFYLAIITLMIFILAIIL